MAEIKISELEKATDLNSQCCFPVVSEGTTKKIEFGTLADLLNIGDVADLNTTDKSNVVAAVNEVNNKVGSGSTTGDTLPVGSIIPFAGLDMPANWLPCMGQELSRTTYADLFAKIGTIYGTGDGSTTFNLPDLRGRVTVGVDVRDSDLESIGNTGGEKEHTLTVDEMPAHDHTIKTNDTLKSSSGIGYYCLNSTEAYAEGAEHVINNGGRISSAGGSQAHNNLQPYLVTAYIIKVSQSAGVVADVCSTEIQSDTDTYSCNYINEINNKLNDSGWIDLELTDDFQIYEGNTYAKYRKIGKMVEIDFQLSPTSNQNTLNTSARSVVATLPQHFRPSYPIYNLAQGSSTNIFLIEVLPSGALRIGRYRNYSSYSDTPPSTTAWLPGHLTYFVD